MQHPDEGTIHAWLDGALPDDEARAVEEHVRTCTGCGARAAEARGLVAGASRILGALDDVPGGVVPAAGGRPHAPWRAWWRRPGIGVAAALTIVAAGTTMVVTRGWHRAPPQAAESTAPMVLRSVDSVMRLDSPARDIGLEADRRDAPEEGQAVRGAPVSPPAAPAPVPVVGSDRQAGRGSAAQIMGERVQAANEAARERVARLDRDAVAAKALTRVIEESVASAPPAALVRDSVAVAETMVPLSDATAGRFEMRAGADSQRADERRALVNLVGCYSFAISQVRDGSVPELPVVVRLASMVPSAADAMIAPAATPFRSRARAQVVPPAQDSTELGWRLVDSDSVAVRLMPGDRHVLVTFPLSGAEPRSGVVKAEARAGEPAWRGPVLVRRVPCS